MAADNGRVMETDQEHIVELRKETLAFGESVVADIGHFAKLCTGFDGLQGRATDVLEALDEAVLGVVGNPEYRESHGLNVGFPRFYDYESERTAYMESGLAFLRDTHWDELLEALYSLPKREERRSAGTRPLEARRAA